MKKIAIINGINLSELGSREINIYGCVDFMTFFTTLQKKYPEFTLFYFQSNQIEAISQYLLDNKEMDGYILNPGAFTHTSPILADTLRMLSSPAIEVHISNIYAREEYRKKSWITPVCIGLITGFGLKGYEMALNYFKNN